MIVTNTPLRSLAARLIANVTSQVGPPAVKWSRGTPSVMHLNSLSGQSCSLTSVGVCGRAVGPGMSAGDDEGAADGLPAAPDAAGLGDAAAPEGAAEDPEPGVAAFEAAAPDAPGAADGAGGYVQPPDEELPQAARTARTMANVAADRANLDRDLGMAGGRIGGMVPTGAAPKTGNVAVRNAAKRRPEEAPFRAAQRWREEEPPGGRSFGWVGGQLRRERAGRRVGLWPIRAAATSRVMRTAIEKVSSAAASMASVRSSTRPSGPGAGRCRWIRPRRR